MDRCDIIKEIASGVNAAVCVEIGTHTGEFSEQILNTFPSSILYCIDPYCSYNEYDDTLNTLTGDKIYINRRFLIRLTSCTLMAIIPIHL